MCLVANENVFCIRVEDTKCIKLCTLMLYMPNLPVVPKIILSQVICKLLSRVMSMDLFCDGLQVSLEVSFNHGGASVLLILSTEI